MKRTLWTAAVTGLLAVCASNCGGGGDDTITAACNKLQTCNSLSAMGYTTVSQCVTDGNQMLSQAGSQKSAVEQQISKCTGYSDCTQFTNCITALASSAH
jgi:hypothetical protein